MSLAAFSVNILVVVVFILPVRFVEILTPPSFLGVRRNNSHAKSVIRIHSKYCHFEQEFIYTNKILAKIVVIVYIGKMANIKSAIKRIKTNKSKREQNKPVKTALATEIKKFRASVEAGELKHAEAQLNVVFSALDGAASDNIIHKNKANRQKSTLAKSLSGTKSSKK
jgi:small subunit ribosomal protein S20